jgi:hypothetical protein
MIIYQSPHIRLVDEAKFISKLQGTQPVEIPVNPQCSGQITCDGNLEGLGVVCTDPGVFPVRAFLPGVACSSAPTCSVTNIFVSGDPPLGGFDCSAVPVMEDCNEGGCLIEFTCGDIGDPQCALITAQIQCTGGEPVPCSFFD